MGFRAEMAGEAVRKLALRDAIAVDGHTVIRGAVALMRSHSLGCVVIVDQHGRPEGVFTEKSLIRVLCDGVCLDTSAVADFQDPRFFVVKQDDPILEVWSCVVEKGARFICVTDQDGRLVGLTGQRGLAEYLCDCFAKQITVQRLGSSPWMFSREGA